MNAEIQHDLAFRASAPVMQIATGGSTEQLRRLNRALLIAAPLLLAVVALLMGKKTGWDFHNYHWYNPFALLHGRLEFDVAVGHHATYYSPLADLPLYWLGSYLPAWVAGAYMGALAGTAVALIGYIAYRTIPGEESVGRTIGIAAVALLSVTGAGAFQEIGDPANDIPAGLGAFAGLALLVYWLGKSPPGHERRYGLPFIAGLCAGASVALKLTAAPYALGLAAALLFVNGTAKQRFLYAATCSIGVAIAMIVVGGFWMYEMWQFSGNPLFPYFNDFFHSPLVPMASHRDLNFRPDDWQTFLTFPWQFTLDSRVVSESTFRDPRILILYALVPIALLLRVLTGNKSNRPPFPEASKLLLAFGATAYVAWIGVFGIYRYLIPLEMLAPLLIVVTVLLIPIGRTMQFAAAATILLFAQLIVRVNISDRQSWEGPYADIAVPALPDPANALVLLAGYAPMSYVIPSFPASIPFLRIDGWLIDDEDLQSGLAITMRRRIANHTGSIFMMFEDHESERAKQAAAQYGLSMQLNSGACRRVQSNIGAPLWMCEAVRS